MKVWVSVHGRFHAFSMASELQARQALLGIATTYPAYMVRRYVPDTTSLRTAPWLEALRRACPYLSIDAARTDLHIAAAFGRFAARSLPATCDVFVGWSGASLETIPEARSRGMRVVIERGSSHIVSQTAVLAEEYARFGIDRAFTHPRLVERELAEYAQADAISVPSSFSASTFEQHGIPRRKLIINPYGVDLMRFTPRLERRRPGPVRVLFVGGVGLRKGVPWLLQAFSRLSDAAELHLVGPWEAASRELLHKWLSPRVISHGPLRSTALEAAYADADVFCLPSIEEGFPLALLQAMAAGLPVVVTPATGAEGFVTNGREGLIVPEREPERLADALAELVAFPERRQTMGRAARERVSQGFSWTDYGARCVAAYGRLLQEREGLNSLAFGKAAG